MAVNIAIDGPAGAGKSTIAKRLARELGYIYVDTGAMYRAMAYDVLRSGIDGNDEAAVSEKAQTSEVSIAYRDGAQYVLLNGEDVTPQLRTEEVGKLASLTSRYPAVREKLVALQRRLAETNDVIMDGRDIGTVVLPRADVKIYLTASPEVRAKRRYDELAARGESCELSRITQNIIARDEQDQSRAVSPLRRAEDAVLLDSSGLDIDGVVARMKDLIADATAGAPSKIAEDTGA